MIDENSPHRLGRRREEVAAVLPACLLRPGRQAKVSFVNKACGVERVARGFCRHANRGEFSQLVIHERKKIGRCLTVALPPRHQAIGLLRTWLCIQN